VPGVRGEGELVRTPKCKHPWQARRYESTALAEGRFGWNIVVVVRCGECGLQGRCITDVASIVHQNSIAWRPL